MALNGVTTADARFPFSEFVQGDVKSAKFTKRSITRRGYSISLKFGT